MSAYIVSKAQIDLMVTGIIHGTRDEIVPSQPRDANALGQMLMAECVRSVKYRYPGDGPGELPGPSDPYYAKPYRHEDRKYRPTAIELYGLIRNYGYQSCEHPEWEGSEAQALTASLEALIESATSEAERDRAPWGMEDEDIAVCRAKLCDEGRALLAAVKMHPNDSTPVSVFSDWLQDHGYTDGPLDLHPHHLRGMLHDIEIPKPKVEHLDRDEAIKRIKAALKRRSGKPWSVTGGRGTAWGWIKIDAPPKRCTWQWVQTRTPEPPAPDAVYAGTTLTPAYRTVYGSPDRITCPEDDPWAREQAHPLYNWEVNRPGESFGHMSPEERYELGQLLGLDKPVHHQGESVPASSDHRAEYVDRAEGRSPAVCGVQYWD